MEGFSRRREVVKRRFGCTKRQPMADVGELVELLASRADEEFVSYASLQRYLGK